MKVLTVTDVSDNVVAQLLERAVAHGVSPEEEHRRLLREALAAPEPGAPSAIEHLLSPEGRVEELPIPSRHRSTHRDVVF